MHSKHNDLLQLLGSSISGPLAAGYWLMHWLLALEEPGLVVDVFIVSYCHRLVLDVGTTTSLMRYETWIRHFVEFNESLDLTLQGPVDCAGCAFIVSVCNNLISNLI